MATQNGGKQLDLAAKINASFSKMTDGANRRQATGKFCTFGFGLR
jgi:hypothetical protein